MTCVVGIAVPGRGTVIAFDSLGGGDGRARIRRDRKGAKLQPWLALGYTTSYRFGQILTHHLDLGSSAPADPYDWAVTAFVPAARAALRDHGGLKRENEVDAGGDVLLGVRDRILVVHSDFQVAELAAGFNAVGSGTDEALAAMWSLTRNTTLAPRRIAVKALEAASEWTVYVRPPWHVLGTRA